MTVTFRMAATLGALVGLVNIVMLAVPEQFAAFHAVTLDPVLTALGGLLAVAYLGFAVLNWSARGVTDPAAQRAVAFANVFSWGVSLVVSVLAQGAGTGANANAWIWVALQAALTAIWGWTLVAARAIRAARTS